MYRSLHTRADVDRLYRKRKKGGKGLISLEDMVRIEKASLGFYLKEKEEQLLREVERYLISDNRDPREVKMEIERERQEKHMNKALRTIFQRN